MTVRWLAAAFLLALAVPLLEGLVPGLSLARGSLAALAVLPWLIVAPLPRAKPAEGSAWRAAAEPACLALPPLFLGAGLDLARGAEPRALLALGASAFVVLCLWSAAAEGAARGSAARAAYAAAWLVLLPGAAALHLALAWVPQRAGAGAPERSALFALDPLVWCHRWGRARGLERLDVAELALALLAATLVLLLVLALRAREAREEAA